MGVNNTFNPDDYGGTTPAAMVACVAAARAAGGAIILSPGKTYRTTATVLLDWQGAGISSATPGTKSKIMGIAPNFDIIQLQGGTGILEQLSVSDLIISRGNASGVEAAQPYPVTPAVVAAIQANSGTGCGIRQVTGPLGTTNLGRSHIQNVEIKCQFNGLHLGGTDFSTLDHVDIHHCASHGIHFYAATYTPLQWYWSGQNVSQMNGGDGLLLSLGPFGAQPSGISIATITNLATFANLGYGLRFLGRANCPVISVRLSDIFVGLDAMDEIFLDTYGWDHRLTGVYSELAIGRGIYLTPNNYRSSLNDCFVTGSAKMGFAISGVDIQLNNCSTSRNGYALLGPALQSGIYVDGTRCSIIGGQNGDQIGGNQVYGLFFGNSNNHCAVGVNNANNTTGPIFNAPANTVACFS